MSRCMSYLNEQEDATILLAGCSRLGDLTVGPPFHLTPETVKQYFGIHGFEIVDTKKEQYNHNKEKGFVDITFILKRNASTED